MSDMVTIAARLGLYLDLMLLFGLPMFGLYTLRGGGESIGLGPALPFGIGDDGARRRWLVDAGHDGSGGLD